MRDIQDIVRDNERVTKEEIPKLVSQGKHVVVLYDGLNFTGFWAYDRGDQAEDKKAALVDEGIPGRRVEILSPAKAAPEVEAA